MQTNRDLLPARSVIAAKEIGGHIRETPLDYSPYFSVRMVDETGQVLG